MFSVRFLLNIFLIISACLLYSCNKSVSVQEFVDKVNKEKDFVKVEEDSTFKITCTYKPSELMALTEMRGQLQANKPINKALFDSTVKMFSSSSYFSLQLSLQSGEDILQRGIRGREDYIMRVNELTYNMSRDFYMLTAEHDTIRTSIFDFQRSYGMSPVVTVLFAFPVDMSKEETDKIELIYTDRLFGIGRPVRFEFDRSDLSEELPSIK